MSNSMTSAMHKIANQTAEQSIAGAVAVGGKARQLLSTARHALTVLGVFAIATLVLMFFKPELADRLQALSPFTPAIAAAPTDDDMPLANLDDKAAAAMPANADNKITVITRSAASDTDIQQKRVTQWLSKRYRVANDATNMLVSAAYSTARDINFDPLLILAVMAIESRFNPFAESPVGAQGLMQVMSKVHYDKFEEIGGSRSALNPVVNIKVGAMILKEYVKSGGSVEAGLKRYVGAADMDSDEGYGAKVLGEYDRLKAVAAGKQVSAFAPMQGRVMPRVETLPKPIDEKSVSADAPVEQKNAMGQASATTI
ncbi:MAG TPA: lytic transglycosylase domain-containing protein [Oxalicibacterium sp.]|jgi:soluble lytic murein transglycosylase-like protein|nr:lytic transglycosylase domain-containing protein [Oxalicibacterium sp.]